MDDRSVTGHSFRLGDWLVTPARHALERDGETVRLKPKAMAVLCRLAARPGRVVTRQELEASVWRNTVVGYDALSNVIIKLRRS